MHSNLSMLTLPEKAMSVKLYFQSGKSATAVLLPYHHKKGIRMRNGPMISSAVKRMISKFEATSCLDDRLCSGRSITSTNAARTIQE